MILPLQSLRGIFALFIFFHHIIFNGKSLFMAGGDFGVAFFFILSGPLTGIVSHRRSSSTHNISGPVFSGSIRYILLFFCFLQHTSLSDSAPLFP